jgi:hypothetical protein
LLALPFFFFWRVQTCTELERQEHEKQLSRLTGEGIDQTKDIREWGGHILKLRRGDENEAGREADDWME